MFAPNQKSKPSGYSLATLAHEPAPSGERQMPRHLRPAVKPGLRLKPKIETKRVFARSFLARSLARSSLTYLSA